MARKFLNLLFILVLAPTLISANVAQSGGGFQVASGSVIPDSTYHVSTKESASTPVSFSGSLASSRAPQVSVAPCVSPAQGYLPLSLFGVAPISGVGDDTITNFNVPSFIYAGNVYSRIGLVSNGYAVVGGGTSQDVAFTNQYLPNMTPPNNVLAPFWTDLNPAAGGAVRIGTLTDGVRHWLILDWENVPNFSNGLPNDFQIWIGTDGVQDVTFAYGDVTLGDMGFLTVGAENYLGDSGQNFYYNGIGTPPGASVCARVSSTWYTFLPVTKK